MSILAKINKSAPHLLWLTAVAAVCGTLYVYKVSTFERYVWPPEWMPEMQAMKDLPEPDRANWPKPPAAWSTERQAVEVATPEGLKVVDIDYHTNSIGMDFVRIEPGSYRPIAGFHVQPNWSLRRASRWQNTHPETPLITISRPYYLGAFEVTNKQFEEFDPGHRARRPRYQQGREGDFHPVEPVTWQEAQRYAHWLSQKEGRRYRLPTEAEWEYAATAGTKTRFYWGDAFWDRAKANLGGLHSNRETLREDGFRQTAPVGTYPANPWGLYDMVGNSYEWVKDWFHEENFSRDATDPQGPKGGKARMGKGGSWTTRPYAMYTGESDGNNPADLRDSRGFRLLVEID